MDVPSAPPEAAAPRFNSRQPAEQGSAILRFLKLFAIAVFVMVLIAAALFSAKESGWWDSLGKSPRLADQPNLLADSPPPKVDLFGPSVGQRSAAFYRDFMDEQVGCQAKAGGIRAVVERIDISPTLPDALGNIYTSRNLGGVQKALKLCAGFYGRSAKKRLALSAAGVDPAVVSYVDQLVALDQQAQDIYEEYAKDPSSKPAQLAVLAARRDAFTRESELSLLTAFEAKYGIKLPSRQEILAQQTKLATDGSAKFLVDNGPKKLADLLIGETFTNNLTGGRWTIDQGEFNDGKIVKSTPLVGCVVFELELSLTGSRSRAPCKINVVLVAAEDPALNMFWVYHSRDAR
jgi:hypothetical protein